MTTPSTTPPIAGDAKAKALVDAFLEEKAKEAPTPTKTGVTNGRAALSIVLAVICAAAWFAPFPKETSNYQLDPLVRAASARVTVFLAAARIRDFRARTGRLPSTLAEAKVTDAGLDYARLTDSVFTLQTIAEGQLIELDSRRDPRAILGSAPAILERKGKGR